MTMREPTPDEREFHRDVWITVLALVSVAIGLYQLATEPEHPTFTWLDAVDLVIVAIFAGDLVYHARRSGSPWRYVARHWWELPSLIPSSAGLLLGVSGISLVRGLRLVTVVRAVRLARVIGVLPRFRGAARYVLRLARAARVGTILGIGAAIVALGSLLGFLVERGANERMSHLGDATWWALNMFTNVAYVDFQPSTASGRVLAAILQVSGIGFIGVFTASLAGAIVREPKEEPRAP